MSYSATTCLLKCWEDAHYFDISECQGGQTQYIDYLVCRLCGKSSLLYFITQVCWRHNWKVFATWLRCDVLERITDTKWSIVMHYTILTRVLMLCGRLCTTMETWKVSFSCLAVTLTHCVGPNKSFKLFWRSVLLSARQRLWCIVTEIESYRLMKALYQQK